MRTKHAAKESTVLYSPTNDPTVLVTHHVPFGKHGELRKHEGKFTAARGKSSSRSGGNTPRCVSESPSPKCDILVKELEGETPRTYLIKDSFLEPECTLTELLQQSPSPCKSLVGEAGGTGTLSRNVIACASPVSNGNKFISEIAEVDWFYDGERLVGGTSCSSGGLRGSVEVEDEKRFSNARELRKLKGKEQMTEENSAEEVVADRGKAPMAFPTEEDISSRFTAGSRCHLGTPESSTVEEELVAGRDREVSVPPDMPPWLRKAYESLTVLDDEPANRSERSAADVEASSSTHWQWKLPTEEPGSVESPGLREKFDAQAEDLSQNEKSQPEMMRVIFGESIREQQVLAKEVEEERKDQGQQGTGWLWKMSLCASVSFVTWVLMNGARIQCRSLFPTIREREQPVKIIRRKPNKLYEVEET